MLDDNKQITAFGILNAEGAVTPIPVTVCGESVTLASELAITLKPLLVDGTDYPSTITPYTSKIPGYASQLTQAGSAAGGFSKAISPYLTPSDLLQMKIGWECHAKGNRLNPVPVFPLVAALNDIITTRALRDALRAITLADLVKAMKSINDVVVTAPDETTSGSGSAGGTGGAGAPPPPPPALTTKQIDDLRVATQTLDGLFSSLNQHTGLTVDYTNQVNQATATAKMSLNNAVAITLTVGLVADPIMAPAIAAIMPPAVIDALKEE